MSPARRRRGVAAGVACLLLLSLTGCTPSGEESRGASGCSGAPGGTSTVGSWPDSSAGGTTVTEKSVSPAVTKGASEENTVNWEENEIKKTAAATASSASSATTAGPSTKSADGSTAGRRETSVAGTSGNTRPSTAAPIDNEGYGPIVKP